MYYKFVLLFIFLPIDSFTYYTRKVTDFTFSHGQFMVPWDLINPDVDWGCIKIALSTIDCL